MSNPWIEEFWRALIIAGICILIGWPLDAVAITLLLGLSVYAGWHMRQAYRLERWLRHGKRFHPPESNGIWEEIFQQIYRLQQRNRRRKRKLGFMLNRFQQATSALPDATVVLGNGDRIEWWNDAAEALLGLEYPRDVGQHVGNLIRSPMFTTYLRSAEFDNPIQMPAPADQQLTLSLRLIRFGTDQRLLVAHDITRIHQLERMRRDFVANVSHELRTPLTVLSGYLETLLDEADDPVMQPWQRTLQTMHKQSNRMQGIVEDLLMLSRLETQTEPEQRHAVAVPGLLAQIREDAQRLSATQGHQITLEAEAELWMQGNESELRSLYSNLAFNAVRYTPAGGRISMRWYKDQRGVHFEIQDTGIGIAQHHIPRLTERFYRVDVGRSRGSGGTGLGLAIVKHVLLRHNGQLRIESSPRQGSTFFCDFPAGSAVHPAHLAVG